MTKEQQRIKIAEACGFKQHGLDEGWPTVGGELCGYLDGQLYAIPNYPADLNAMHEAEKVLQSRLNNWWGYCDLLLILAPAVLGNCTHVHATAELKAEAFLKTLGLWEDGE